MAERCRLFFALWPEAAFQNRCAEWVREHLPNLTGRLLSPANLHITLVFVGDVEAERQGCVEEVAGRVRGSPFTLTLDRLGYWRRPQVIWLGARQSPPALIELVAQLRTGLKACEVVSDRRPFQAHMTVARKVKKGTGSVSMQAMQWPVEDFALVGSELRPEGACYHVLQRWPLR